MSFPNLDTPVWIDHTEFQPGFFYNTLYDPLSAIPNIANNSSSTAPLPKGIDPVVQVFYEGPEKCECCVNWIEKEPAQIPEYEKSKYDKAAICVYKRKDHDHDTTRKGGLITLVDERVVLQSQLLLDLIRPALSAVGVVVPVRGDMEFVAPFKELFFSHDRIYDIQNSLPEQSESRKHVELLITVMSSLLYDLTSSVVQLQSKRSITYEYLWTLFPKHMIVYAKLRIHDRLYQVVSVEKVYSEYCYRHKSTKNKDDDRVEVGVHIKCQYFAFDGTNFGVRTKIFHIPKFDGEKLVAKLSLYPLAFHEDPKLEARLSDRGRQMLEFQVTRHCEYEGISRRVDDSEPTFLTGRVVVDAFYFSKQHLDETELTDPLDYEEASGDSQTTERTRQAAASMHALQSKLPRVAFHLDRRQNEDERELGRQYLEAHPSAFMLMNPEIPGYSLRYNKWFWLDITKIRAIDWISEPLDRLVLLESTKSMLSSFAKNHSRLVQAKEDFLTAKGSGLVVLLSGPPGTGKTLTAEAIAEEAMLPLYRIIAGEFGSTPTSIEHKLSQVLDLATQWNSIVLLDEADTFIHQRAVSDRTASEIVSIFLRQLEYFRGIIFLTTNQPDDIDNAFRSRCRLHLRYPLLNSTSRTDVWRIKFGKVGLVEGQMRNADKGFITLALEQNDWHVLKSWQLNGREIHNVVENVLLWCTVTREDVPLDKLESTIKLTAPHATQVSNEVSSVSDDIIAEAGASPGTNPRKRLRPA